jgi:hypothetical protein
MEFPSIKDLTVATREVATKSAMNPIQWICALTTPASITAACFVQAPFSYAFFLLAACPVAYAFRAYDYYMKNDRDRLQSERYLIERQVVGTIGLNNEGQAPVVISTTGSGVPNPRLIEGKTDDK